MSCGIMLRLLSVVLACALLEVAWRGSCRGASIARRGIPGGGGQLTIKNNTKS